MKANMLYDKNSYYCQVAIVKISTTNTVYRQSINAYFIRFLSLQFKITEKLLQPIQKNERRLSQNIPINKTGINRVLQPDEMSTDTEEGLNRRIGSFICGFENDQPDQRKIQPALTYINRYKPTISFWVFESPLYI